MITKVVVIRPAVGEITNVVKTTANKKHGAYNTYYIDTTAASGKIYSTVVDADLDVDTIVTEAELAKKDIVTYYKGAAKLYIDATESISGVLSAIDNDNVLTIDGVKYDWSVFGTLPTVGKKSQDFYLDSMGNVIKSYTTTTTNYAYVIPGTVKQVMVAKADNTFETVDRATIVLPDGSVETVTTSAAWTSYAGKAITYTVNTKDEYVYGAAAGEAFTGLADDTIAITTNLKANTATLYIVCNYVDDDDDSSTPKVFSDVTLYTGYKSVPVYAASSLANAYAIDTDSTADGLANVAFIGDISASATETGKYVYVTGTYVNTTAGFVFDAIVAGDAATYTKSSASALAADTLYTDITTASAASVAGQKVQNKGGLLYIDGTYTGKTIADDVKVYTINMADDSVSVGTAADLATEVDASPVSVTGGDATRGVYVEYDTGATKAVAVYVLFNSED